MKRISSGTVTVFVLAIVVGLGAAFFVKMSLQPKAKPVVEAPKVPTMPAVVATRNLPENYTIRPGDVRVVQIPVAKKKDGVLRIAKQAEGRIVKGIVKAGAYIHETNLHGIGEELPPLETRIPPGLRAMPINVDEQSVVAKMINIGSHVDIALTAEGKHPDLGERATKTLLHNVQVISVDKPAKSRRSGAVAGQAVITVAVTPADANVIINAEGKGTLDLTLCSPSEREEHQVSTANGDNRTTWNDLLGLKPIPVPPAPPAPPAPMQIEHWSGGSVKIITVPQSRINEAQRATENSTKFNPPGHNETKNQKNDADNGTVSVNDFVPNADRN